MKPIRYTRAYKTSNALKNKSNGVYLVSCRNPNGEISYNFVSVTSQGRWLLENLQASNAEWVGGVGKVIASCSGANPIQHLKQQMDESALLQF